MGTEKAVIIAEPSEMLLKGLRPFLADNDLSVIHVRTQKEALLTLQNQRVHAMVLDADLLEEDCEFISLVKGMQANLPIIVCAAVNTPEFEIRIRQKRIFYYHIKSFGIEDLEMALSNAILKVSHDLGGPSYGHR
ncbi:MAG: response regulator [Deltaproteobacteria bacterium]|nr:response regulator [Deltaproteobacteria bacterium]